MSNTNGNRLLTKISAQPRRKEMLQVPEWDVTLEIRSGTVAQRTALLNDGYNKKPDGTRGDSNNHWHPLLLRASCFDPETGIQVFADVDDAFILSLDPVPVDRIVPVALRVWGLATVDLEKNSADSASSPTATTSTPSPLSSE